MRTGISFKVNLIILLVVFVMGSALGILIIVDQHRTLHRELNRRIQIIGEYMSEELAEAGIHGDGRTVNRILEAAVLDGEINYAMVISPEGEILASRWNVQTRGEIHEHVFSIRPLAHARGLTAEPFGPVSSSKRNAETGRLALGVDLSPLQSALMLLIARTAVAVLLAIVVSLVMGTWLINMLFRRALTPLLSGIEAIGAGRLSQRIDPDRNDEVGQIGRAFNVMVERLSATLISKEQLEGAVTERTAELKAALDERIRAQAELADREERIRLLLDSAAEAIYGIDLKGRCTFCNSACLRMLGYERQEDLIGKNMHAAIHHTKADGTFYPEQECPIFEVFRTGSGNHLTNEVFWKADGSSMHVEYWSYPILQNGELAGAVITFLDITERLRLEQQLLQAQKMEAIGMLAGGVAHDFNNILTAVIGYGSLLQRKMPDNDPMRSNVDQIIAAANRAAQLTRSLLAFSRKQVMDMKPTHLNGIIAGQELFLRRIIGEDIDMKTILHRDAVIMADSSQIELILMNLATNARDAMPKGGSLTIETDVTDMTGAFVDAYGFGTPGTYAVISVTDTGTGMDEQTQQKIFDPFFTTKGVGRGTGLGLAIIYGIVKQHKGYITVYSQVGKGTTFKIYIPVHRERAAEHRQQLPAERALTGTETLLLAEDDAILRTFFKEVLTEYGYTVITAENGEDAVRKFEERKDDLQLVIVDMVMPKIGGREVYEAVRKMKPEIKVIFSSGYSADKVQGEGLPPGCEFIAKPATPMDYLSKIRDTLDGVSAG